METYRISYPVGSVPALLQAECEFRHFKKNTFKAYNYWLMRFWNFHGKKPVRDLREPEIKSFLASLRHGSASAQDQAFNALIFLYKHVEGLSPKEITSPADMVERSRVLVEFKSPLLLA